MELRFAVVEDRLPDAQRLESLLRLAFGGGQPLVCDHYESGDAFSGGVPQKNIRSFFSTSAWKAPTASRRRASCAGPIPTCC